MNRDELKGQAEEALAEARGIAAKAESAGRDFTAEERDAVKAALDLAKTAKAQLAVLDGDDQARRELSDIERALAAGQVSGGTKSGSIGERVVRELTPYIDSLRLTAGGEIPQKARIHSPAVGFGMKDIITGSENDRAGAFINPDYRGLVDEGTWRRPLTIRNLVTQSQTNSDSIHFVRQLTPTSNATIVPEATGTSAGTGLGDVSGEKPESDMTWETDTASVVTLAHWLPITRRALADAAQVRSYVDSFLRYGLDELLEDQMLNGNGSGENFDGILHVSGTQSQAWSGDIFETVRKARTKARVIGRARNLTVLLAPEDEEMIDLQQDGYGRFYGNGPFSTGPSTLWGMPVVVSEAITKGTAIVGDFSWATLWDRQAAAIMVSDSHADFFVRNLVAILAEMRAGFTVVRPSAFVVVDTAA